MDSGKSLKNAEKEQRMIAILTEKIADGNKWIDLYETMEQAVEELIEEHSIVNPEFLRGELDSEVLTGFVYRSKYLPDLEAEDDNAYDNALHIESIMLKDHCAIPHYPLLRGSYGGVVTGVVVVTPCNVRMQVEIGPQIEITGMCDKCEAVVYEGKLCKTCWEIEEEDL